MKICDWCKKVSVELNEHTSGGTGISYRICGDCLDKALDDTCRKCGELIIGKDIAGICTGCAQEESTEAQIKINEVAEGVSIDILEELTTDVVFTEGDYENWVMLSQKGYTKEQIRRNRTIWLKSKLLKAADWNEERIEKNADNLSELIDRYSSNILKNEYVLIYYPETPEEGFKGKRPTASVLDRIGDVILVKYEN